MALYGTQRSKPSCSLNSNAKFEFSWFFIEKHPGDEAILADGTYKKIMKRLERR